MMYHVCILRDEFHVTNLGASLAYVRKEKQGEVGDVA